MTTKDKALALLNEVSLYKCENVDTAPHKDLCIAFRRAIEQHEATKQELADFKQKVSDALRDYYGGGYVPANSRFAQFIIPKPKPDPLLAALLELELSSDLQEGQHDAKWIRNKLDELGFEIREKNDD